MQRVVDSLDAGRSDVILVRTHAGTARRAVGQVSASVVAEVVGMLKALPRAQRGATHVCFHESLDRWVHTRSAPGILLVWVFGRDRDPEMVRLLSAQAIARLEAIVGSMRHVHRPDGGGERGPEGASSHAFASRRGPPPS